MSDGAGFGRERGVVMLVRTRRFGWLCEDCAMWVAYDQAPESCVGTLAVAEWKYGLAQAAEAWAADSWHEWSIVLGGSPHNADCDPLGSECECDTITYSEHPCDICNDTFGGSRHAATVIIYDN